MPHETITANATLDKVKTLLVVPLFWAYAATCTAGEIQSLSWANNDDKPVLEVRVAGDAAYQVQALEGGQRLRVSFPGSTLGSGLNELAGQKQVKGVYP